MTDGSGVAFLACDNDHANAGVVKALNMSTGMSSAALDTGCCQPLCALTVTHGWGFFVHVDANGRRRPVDVRSG